jgi:ankyrin repeat protein
MTWTRYYRLDSSAIGGGKEDGGRHRHDSDAVMQRLLEAKECVDDTDADGLTALMYAAWNGFHTTVQQQLSAGADFNFKRDGTTALDLACIEGRVTVVQLLRDANAAVNPEIYVAYVRGQRNDRFRGRKLNWSSSAKAFIPVDDDEDNKIEDEEKRERKDKDNKNEKEEEEEKKKEEGEKEKRRRRRRRRRSR